MRSGREADMIAPPMAARPATRRRVVVACALAASLVLFRSAMFVFRPQLAFDADQAVFGLMAKHLIEGRAFPLYMYGQNYILAVEAWMAAPMFLLFGVSVTALKLPLLVVNLAVGILLVALLHRETGLGAGLALAASVFFLLAPPGTTARLLETSGGNVEPFLYVLLLWITRRRPVWFGLILGVGFLQREFTAYGAIAIVAIEAAHGAWRTREGWRRAVIALGTTTAIWCAALFLRRFASSAGPGTDATSVQLRMNNNVLEAMQRFCFDPAAALGGLGRLVTFHWPRLFGTARLPLVPFGLESAVSQGLAWSGLALGALIMLCIARIAVHARARGSWWTQVRVLRLPRARRRRVGDHVRRGPLRRRRRHALRPAVDPRRGRPRGLGARGRVAGVDPLRRDRAHRRVVDRVGDTARENLGRVQRAPATG